MFETSNLFTILGSFPVGVAIGWFAKLIIEKGLAHRFGIESAKMGLIWQNEIEHRKTQLCELYGPIYSILKTNSEIYSLWMSHKIPEANFEIKQFFAKNNDEIRNILINKIHLMEGAEMPPQFVHFMTSAMIWNWYCAAAPDAEFPEHVAQLDLVQWPKQFELHIYTTTEILKHRLDKLYNQYALTDTANTA